MDGGLDRRCLVQSRRRNMTDHTPKRWRRRNLRRRRPRRPLEHFGICHRREAERCNSEDQFNRHFSDPGPYETKIALSGAFGNSKSRPDCAQTALELGADGGRRGACCFAYQNAVLLWSSHLNPRSLDAGTGVARSREMSGKIAYNWSGTESSHPVPSSGEMLLGQATRLLTSE